jgi:hypothetical protein
VEGLSEELMQANEAAHRAAERLDQVMRHKHTERLELQEM